MSLNPQLTYQDILVETDKEARDEYVYDPREHFLSGPIGPEVPAKEVEVGAEVDTGYTLEETHANTEYNTHNDMKIVQAPPKLIPKKHVVIIDTAQRDWVQQPNAYDISFYFNSPGVNDASTMTKTPIYENNKYIPLSAVENLSKVPNMLNVTKTLLPQYTRTDNPLPIPKYPQTVYDSTGRSFTVMVIPDECYYGFSLIMDDGTTRYFPTYIKDAQQGRIITYDVVNNEYIENFSTRQTLSNVISIRMIKAVLPNRRFLNFDNSMYGTDSTISSFASEPYLLLKVNNFQGYYNGGNDPTTSAFSVLSQNQRNAQSLLSNQFQDYYPLVDEAYTFNAPLSYIPKFDITLMKNTGNVFAQYDDITITKMTYVANTGTALLSDGNGAIIKCSINRSGSNRYNLNELRPGDRIQFHKKMLAKILLHRKVAASTAYRNLFTWLLTNDAIVRSNQNTLSSTESKAAYDTEFTFIYDPVTRFGTVPTNAGLSSTNFPILFSSSATDSNPAVVLYDSTTDYSLPIMNTNLQSMFSFEVVTMEPDITQLGGSGAR